MSIQISPVIAVSVWKNGGVFSAKSIKLHELGERASPIVVLDDFRVRGQPFAAAPARRFLRADLRLRRF